MTAAILAQPVEFGAFLHNTALHRCVRCLSSETLPSVFDYVLCTLIAGLATEEFKDAGRLSAVSPELARVVQALGVRRELCLELGG